VAALHEHLGPLLLGLQTIQNVILIDEEGKALSLMRPPDVPVQAPAPAHSPDWVSINWYGTHYEFTPTQGKCVRALWQAWKTGVPELSQQRILEAANSAQDRLKLLFRGKGKRGMHPAWGTLIVSPQRGFYRLQPPVPERALPPPGTEFPPPRPRS
jgi:hypothetical protein